MADSQVCTGMELHPLKVDARSFGRTRPRQGIGIIDIAEGIVSLKF